MRWKQENPFKKKQRNLIAEISLFFLPALCINLAFQIERNKLASVEVCQAVANNYLEGLSAKEFNQCLSLIKPTDFSNSSKIKKINKWLSKFHISHLYIYNSKQNKKMWQGISQETGIVAKNIFNKWKVIKVLGKSKAIEIGDRILFINGKKVKSAQHILNTEGEFLVLRKGKKIRLSVKYSKITYDERMVVSPINSKWSYLKIPSFKSEFFGYDELARIFKPLHKKQVIIDVRDNLGGNFISTVRLLSMLKCTDQKVGTIFHNRSNFDGINHLKDDLSDSEQILQVTNENPVYLKLFRTELCLKTEKIVVIMNENTSSVSELFVQILKNQYSELSVFGTNSAGQMVLSIWYPLKYLGPQVMVSIPYAWATANDQEILEGLGVSPTESIDSDYMKKFIDSLDPLLDYVLDKKRIKMTSKSSLGGLNG